MFVPGVVVLQKARLCICTGIISLKKNNKTKQNLIWLSERVLSARGSQSGFPEASVQPGNLQMMNLGPHSRPTALEILGLQPGGLCFHKPVTGFHGTLKFLRITPDQLNQKSLKRGGWGGGALAAVFTENFLS